MGWVVFFVRRAEGGVERFDTLDEARAAAREGDVIAKGGRGGHMEHELIRDGQIVEVERGNRPPTE